jgi:hypothetical protein
VETLEPLVVPGSPGFEAIQQGACLLDVEGPEVGTGGDPRLQRRQRSGGEPTCQRGLSHQHQAGKPAGTAEPVALEAYFFEDIGREILSLIHHQDQAPTFDVGLGEMIGQVESRGGGHALADQAQGMPDRPVEVGGGVRGREFDVDPIPGRRSIGAESAPEPGLADARFARDERGALLRLQGGADGRQRGCPARQHEGLEVVPRRAWAPAIVLR